MADIVLCMTTNPGVFGESFIPSVADKVKNLCELREQKGYSYQIQVDGSINDQTAIVCKKAGADILFQEAIYLEEILKNEFTRLWMQEKRCESKRKFRTYFKGTSRRNF